MALIKKSLKEDLKAKDLTYQDNFLVLKHKNHALKDCFNFKSYDALKNIVDFKTNNYSNLFLTNLQQTSNWLESNQKKVDGQLGLITTLSFFSSDPQRETSYGAWLYFDKTYEFWDAYVTEVSYTLTKNRPLENYKNYIFYINFVDDLHCEITHTFSDMIFYFTIGVNGVIRFVKEKTEDALFLYKLNGNHLKLYKNFDGDLYRLNAVPFEDKDYTNLILEKIEGEDSSNDGLIYISNNILDFEYYVDNSWVQYDRKTSVDHIYNPTSLFSLSSQSLIHHQYNKKDGEVNFIPLKNNFTYKNNSLDGDNMTISRMNLPSVNYRNYTAINSGMNQELGHDNIILNFVFHDQEFTLEEGEKLAFTIPTVEENGGVQPLYPYLKINVNDTKFVDNGAFGTDVPWFADKFRLYLDGKRQIEKYPNNKTYLCTWLYKKDLDSEPVWLDRYYYPDKISKEEALKGEKFEQSFQSVIENVYLNENFKEEYPNVENNIAKDIVEHSYIDKLSDVCLESGGKYIYSRFSKNDRDAVLNTIEEKRIRRGKKKNGAFIDLMDDFKLDGTSHIRLDNTLFQKTNAININFDLYLNPEKKMGIQLFGSDYTQGFNIQNRKDLAPFHYYATETTMYLFNNDGLVKRELNIFEKYNDKIVRFVLGDLFDDIIIISPLYFYILTYDLKLKTKFAAQDVYGFSEETPDKDKLSLGYYNETDSSSIETLMTYPYSNDGVKTKSKVLNTGSETAFISDDVFNSSCPVERMFAINSVNAGYTSNSGTFNIYTKFSEIISSANSIIYKNNLYIPYKETIIKMIFTPDAEKDFSFFTEEMRSNYIAAVRILDEDEYYVSYNKSGDFVVENEYESTIYENDFIETDGRIKNIHIDKNGNIYGFNYDKIAVDADGDIVYGLYAKEAYLRSGGWWWLYNQSLSKIQSRNSTSKYAEYASQYSIDNMCFNKKGEMLLVRNFNNFVYEDYNGSSTKRIEVYDKTKKKIYSENISYIGEILSVDSYSYIDVENKEKTVFCLMGKYNGDIIKIEYISEEKRILLKTTQLPAESNANFYQTTNTSSLMRYTDKNSLYFNLHIPSPYLYDYILTHEYPIHEIERGWYNFNISINLNDAFFEVRVNDIKLVEYNEKNTKFFKPFANANSNMFDSTYYVGCIGKQYGTTLSNILYNNSYDPYLFRNSHIKNLKIYNKILDYHEYAAMRMENEKINDLIITIPCGYRNMIEEIVRYFKYNAPSSISNKVRINIGGTGLKTKGEYELLKKELMEAIQDNVDSTVDVKDIEII